MNIANQSIIITQQFDTIVDEIIKRKNDDSFYHKIQFNTHQLIDHNNYKTFPNSDNRLSHLFTSLNTVRNHCLYWFELDSIKKAIELNSLLNSYRFKKDKIPNYKTVPATNSNQNSNVLYVGIRQGGGSKDKKDKEGNVILGLTNIVGRINQHLGYYHVASTQGLQLYEYAKGLDFNITIKVIEFVGLETKYLNIIEKLVAKELKPLSGRH